MATLRPRSRASTVPAVLLTLSLLGFGAPQLGAQEAVAEPSAETPVAAPVVIDPVPPVEISERAVTVERTAAEAAEAATLLQVVPKIPILELLQSTGIHDRFAGLVVASGLVETLDDGRSITVLAPTDAAMADFGFAAAEVILPQAAEDLVRRHVLPGRVTADVVAEGSAFWTTMATARVLIGDGAVAGEPLGAPLNETGTIIVRSVDEVVAATDLYAQSGRSNFAGEAIQESERSLDELVAVMAESLDTFWTARLVSLVGTSYTRPDLAPYGRIGDPEVRCSDDLLGPNDALYCHDGNFVAYDAEFLLPNLREQYGDVGPLLVLAHEWGHHIQSLMRTGGPSILRELQADCYAGASLAWLRLGGSADLRLTQAEIDAAVRMTLRYRDGRFATADDVVAHGSGYDRLNAFADGYVGSAGSCTNYEESPPTWTLPASPADVGGDRDLALPVAIDTFLADLLDEWDLLAAAARVALPTPEIIGGVDLAELSALATPCPDRVETGGGLYCPEDNSIGWDSATATDLFNRGGDGAIAWILADAWGTAAAHQLGVTEPSLVPMIADCLAGAYLRQVADGNRSWTLTNGDLDQILETIVGPEGGTINGAFVRLIEFRGGWRLGSNLCIAAASRF